MATQQAINAQSPHNRLTAARKLSEVRGDTGGGYVITVQNLDGSKVCDFMLQDDGLKKVAPEMIKNLAEQSELAIANRESEIRALKEVQTIANKTK